VRIVALLTALILMVGCEGDPGPAGPKGPEGEDGPPGSDWNEGTGSVEGDLCVSAYFHSWCPADADSVLQYFIEGGIAVSVAGQTIAATRDDFIASRLETRGCDSEQLTWIEIHGEFLISGIPPGIHDMEWYAPFFHGSGPVRNVIVLPGQSYYLRFLSLEDRTSVRFDFGLTDVPYQLHAEWSLDSLMTSPRKLLLGPAPWDPYEPPGALTHCRAPRNFDGYVVVREGWFDDPGPALHSTPIPITIPAEGGSLVVHVEVER